MKVYAEIKTTGITWLLLLNFVVLQWFTLRLTRVAENVSVGFECQRERTPEGEIILRNPQLTEVACIQRRWEMQHGIVPLTGWWDGLWPKYKRLWKTKSTISR